MLAVSRSERVMDLAKKCGVGAACVTLLFSMSAAIKTMAPSRTLIEGAQVNTLEIDAELLGNRAGSGLIFGILGGFRTIAADISWLRMNEAWEDKLLAETEALIRLTLLIDSRPEVFWKAGAHTLTFDMPVWRIRAGGGESVVPESVQERIHGEQLQRGVDLLKQGALLYPESPTFPIEIGKFYLIKNEDFAKAATYFRMAWEMPNSPYFVGRALARVLERDGRPKEALDVLKADLKQLPADDPESYIDLVRERIAEIEFKYGL